MSRQPLAPARNLPETCAVLGDALPVMTSACWAAEWCTDVLTALAPEAPLVAARLAASRAVAAGVCGGVPPS